MKLNLLTEEEVRTLVAQEVAKFEARMINILSKMPRQEVKCNLSESDPIQSLMFSGRAEQVLTRVGIDTVGKLTSHTAGELLRYRLFGKKTFHEVVAKLAANGLGLKSPL